MRTLMTLCLTLVTFSVSAANYTLTNTVTPVDLNVAGNWDGGSVPGAGDDVFITNLHPQTLTLSGVSSMTWNSLTLFGTNNVTKTFDVGAARSLTILNGVRIANQAGATNRMMWSTGSLFVTNDSRTSTITIGYTTGGASPVVGSGDLTFGSAWTVVVDRVNAITNPPPNTTQLNSLYGGPQALFEVRNGGTHFSDNIAYQTRFKLSGGFWRRNNGYASSYAGMLFGRGGITLQGPGTWFRHEVANGSFRSNGDPGTLIIITNGAVFESARTGAGTMEVGDSGSKGALMVIADNGVLTTRIVSVTLGSATANGSKPGTNSILVCTGGKVYCQDGYVGRLTGGPNVNNQISFNSTLTVRDLGSEWRCRGTFYAGSVETTGTNVNNNVIQTNTVIVADSGLLAAVSGVIIGNLAGNVSGTWSIVENKVQVSGGTILATNGAKNGTVDVRNGQIEMSSGLIRADRFLATNGANSVLEFTGGTLSGAVVIGAGTTLKKEVTIIGTVTNYGILSPGASIGTLSFSNDLAMLPGSVYNWEIGDPGTSDLAIVAGALRLGSSVNSITVNVSKIAGATQSGFYPIFKGATNGSLDAICLNYTGGLAGPPHPSYDGTYVGVTFGGVVLTPYVEITNLADSITVSNYITSIAVAGTNSEGVVGGMWYTSKTGAQVNDSGTVAPAAGGGGWTFTVNNLIELATNLITITGTNNLGTESSDSIRVYRTAASPPFVDITNADFTVSTSIATIGGTSANTVGYLAWDNSLGGSGSIAASPAWEISAIPLTVGDNVITVTGTNATGDAHYDFITITRQSGNAPSDVADFVIALATANYSTIMLGWSNNTATILVCTNQSYTSDLSYWFELASGVTSPWTHEDASNYPTIFYRIVSGVYTSQYDVGKYSVTLAPGTGSDPANNWISPPLELFSNTVGYVLGTQLNYDESNFDILKSQSSIGSDAQVDTYYFAGTWTDFDQESTRFATGRGYMLVVDATHTQPKTVAFVGKVPDAAVTNVISAPNGTDPVYNWIGAPSPALRQFVANGLTNPVVTTEADANFDLYKHQVTMGADAQKDWYYLGGVWDDFESGTPEQTPGKGGMLVLDAIHTGADTTWAAPKTR